MIKNSAKTKTVFVRHILFLQYSRKTTLDIFDKSIFTLQKKKIRWTLNVKNIISYVSVHTQGRHISGFKCLIFCLFVFWVPLDMLSIIWRHHNYRWRAPNFELYYALLATRHWGFFSVPYLPWYRGSVYNGHLQGLVTVTPIAERFPLKLLLPVLTTCAAAWIRTPTYLYTKRTLLPNLPEFWKKGIYRASDRYFEICLAKINIICNGILFLN